MTTDDELALRAALNVLRDTIESVRMPSGLLLAPEAAELHERAARQLEALLRNRCASPAHQAPRSSPRTERTSATMPARSDTSRP